MIKLHKDVTNLKDSAISERTRNYLLKHGLAVEIMLDKSPEDPRIDGIATIVGIDDNFDVAWDDFKETEVFLRSQQATNKQVEDHSAQELNAKSNGIEGNVVSDYIGYYCKEVLDCSINDIIWHVYDSRIIDGAFTAERSEDKYNWAEGSILGAFAFVTVSDALLFYNEKELSESSIQDIYVGFDVEIGEYNDWENGKVYKAILDTKQEMVGMSKKPSVEPKSVEPESEWSGFNLIYMFDIIGMMDASIYDDAEDTVSSISYHKEDMVTLAVTCADNNDDLLKNMPSLHFIQHLEKEMNFTPAIGDITINEDKRKVIMDIQLSSIPKFSVLREEQKHLSDISKNLRLYANEIVDRNLIEQLTDIEFNETINTVLEYKDWSPVMIHALMMLLLEHVDDMDFCHVQKHTIPTIEEGKAVRMALTKNRMDLDNTNSCKVDVNPLEGNERLYKKLTEAVFKEVKKNQVLSSKDFLEDWCFTDEEWQLVSKTLTLIDEKEFVLSEVKAYLESFFEIDCQTLRLINKGYRIGEVELDLNFEHETDALDYMNSKGNNFTHWHQVQEEADMGRIKWSNHWDNGIGAAQSVFNAADVLEKAKADAIRIKQRYYHKSDD